MLTIDSQVHAYERDHPGRPWHAVLHGPDEVTGDDMVAAMDAVGVDGALLVSPFTMYRYDASYAIAIDSQGNAYMTGVQPRQIFLWPIHIKRINPVKMPSFQSSALMATL